MDDQVYFNLSYVKDFPLKVFEATPKTVFLYLVFLVAVISAAYTPSLTVPFYLDDNDSIVTNTLVNTGELGQIWHSYLRPRFIGYASLWVNYQLGELEPYGYHAVNIAIHMINVLLVFLLALELLKLSAKTSKMALLTKPNNFPVWALLIATLWGLHPLNSQAVIYVVQRLASIATLFVLLTCIFYLKAKFANTMKHKVMHLVLALLCVAGGFLSKQNYVIVFAFIFLLELSLGSVTTKRVLWRMATAGLVVLAFLYPFLNDYWLVLDQATRDPGATQRNYYFFTQTIVIWDYVLRFFLPVNLQLNIDVALMKSLEPVVFFALIGHLSLMTLAYQARERIPLFFIGILLFYCSHLVESFIIPIKDLAFEHRTYTGNVGLVIALIGVGRYFVETRLSASKAKVASVSVFALIVISAVATYSRAVAWQDPFTFFEKEVKLAPEHQRTNSAFGRQLLLKGDTQQAEYYLKKSVDISMANNSINAGALTLYMAVLFEQGKFPQGTNVAMLGLRYIKNPIQRSDLLNNLGVGYIKMRNCGFAVGLLTQAIKLNPNNEKAKSNLALCQ